MNSVSVIRHVDFHQMYLPIHYAIIIIILKELILLHFNYAFFYICHILLILFTLMYIK